MLTCIIYLDNSAWIMICVAMICFTILVLPFMIALSKLIRKNKEKNQNRKTTVTYKKGDDESCVAVETQKDDVGNK